QNATLRPVLKMQHELLIAVFRDYMQQKKIPFAKLTRPQQLEQLQQVFYRDHRFKNLLKGIVLGQFTVEEYAIYLGNSSPLSKRMFALLKERLTNSLPELSN
ncbi:MAG: glyoxalase, partial [Bacteroidota bacterium]